MNLHRLTTHNLPSIQIHDQNFARSPSDHHHHSSTLSQRSMPREIPIPRLGASPTSSRCGSFHGSYASTTVVPPILPLDAPGLPPPPSRHRDLRQSSSIGSAGGDDSDGEELGRRAVFGSREAQEWKLSPICNSFKDGLSLPGSHDGASLRSEGSHERNWRENFYNNKGRVKELSDESLRATMRVAVQAYDQTVLGKLNARTSEPSSFTQHKLTPPQEIRAFAAAQEVGSLPRLTAPWTSGNRHLPASAGVSPRTSDSPLDPWGKASGSDSIHLGVKRETFTPPIFSSSLSEFRKNEECAASLPSRTADGGMSPSLDNRVRRSASASNLGPGYDSLDEDMQMEDAPSSHVSQMNRLTLRDARTPPHQHERVGFKRRASSPPRERDHRSKPPGTSEPTKQGLMLEGVCPDMYGHSRRTPPIHHRASPGVHQKYYNLALPRSASSSLASVSTNSATTMWSTSMGQFSPATSSLSTQTDWSPVASYNPSMEADGMKDGFYRQFPPSSLGRPGGERGRLPEISSLGRDKDLAAMKHNPAPKMTGIFICECCPKKPKKFDNRSDLQLHELEKQYSCLYCNNRFKNKNEAERHQNSLHLRKHSWSCASLAGNYEAAFHQSTHRPNFADVCGYCGKEFPMPAQWALRIEHLTQEHKFGECNQSKKFYRADHFRQHLKHSHSGTSGKWTNVLENACMRDEIPPQPINRGSTSSIGCDIGTPSGEGSD